MTAKGQSGIFFEDFQPGQLLRHGIPRTLCEGDAAIYLALTGNRAALSSADTTARLCGLPHRPLDDWLVFNIAFGRTVPDVSQNALANLGYAEVRFLHPVYAGTTLRCESLVIGMREISSGAAGILHVRSSCFDEHDRLLLTWVRWVMIPKRTESRWTGTPVTPDLLAAVPFETLSSPVAFPTPDAVTAWCLATASTKLWDDYAIGERIRHPNRMTLEESDHMAATRLYQNNAQVHFIAGLRADGKVRQRIVYGGHVISICQALSHEGLENRMHVTAINAGRHISPVIAGDVLSATSIVLDRQDIAGRRDVGLIRMRLLGMRNTVADAVDIDEAGDPSIVLDLDYTAVFPRRQG